MRAMIGATVAALVLLGLATAAAAQGDVAEFRRLRSEAVAAANADDIATADDRLARADALIPNHPGLILMRARLAARSGDLAQGVAHLGRYADAGLIVDPSRDPSLSLLAETPGYADIVARIAANREPVGAGRLSVVATLPAGVLAESVARDEARGRWLVSQIAGRTIVAVADAGAVTPFMEAAPDIGGVLGIVVDAERGRVWAVTAPLPPATHGQTAAPPTALLEIDLATGRILARYPAPDAQADRTLGDIALGPDGMVYVADSGGGEVFRLTPGAETLTVFVGPGPFGSPQGMTVTPDGQALIVVDYSSGLYRVEMATGGVTQLAAPADASLIGVDGLTRDGRALYAIQNGVNPQRVLKLGIDAGWTRIDAVQVLAANLPEMDEPTTGLVHAGGLVFVSRSQWSDFDDDGAPKAGANGPAIIARLRLD
jgi:sugar lactone lactonase YvrE